MMVESTVRTLAHPNIAFIKYWGNADSRLRLPSNASFSMNLAALTTQTTISPSNNDVADKLTINGETQAGDGLNRFRVYLDTVRDMYHLKGYISVESKNNFPMAAGIASSASAYAALAMGINEYFELRLSQQEISALARLGSGSACRSIPGGFVEWEKGISHASSAAFSVADKDHWDLHDCILVVNKEKKKVSSTQGHSIADTSALQSVRVHDTPRRLAFCREAVLKKDFEKLAYIIEQDSNMMHAVMMTSDPILMYWQPASVAIMHEISELRNQGIPCAYTMDAGPNVHVICTAGSVEKIRTYFSGFPGVEDTYVSKTGGPAEVI